MIKGNNFGKFCREKKHTAKKEKKHTMQPNATHNEGLLSTHTFTFYTPRVKRKIYINS